jgi:hypothetical protein
LPIVGHIDRNSVPKRCRGTTGNDECLRDTPRCAALSDPGTPVAANDMGRTISVKTETELRASIGAIERVAGNRNLRNGLRYWRNRNNQYQRQEQRKKLAGGQIWAER